MPSAITDMTSLMVMYRIFQSNNKAFVHLKYNYKLKRDRENALRSKILLITFKN